MNRDIDQTLGAWPKRGAIELRDVSLRYRPNTPVILKGVTFRVEGGEKVGVVGRTGSGKSSLIQALFRIVELQRGTIYIDDLDVSTIGLSKLRRAMTLIPQDPLLFKGTMRDNIDPFHHLSDSRVSEVLATVNLTAFQADSQVQESGNNLSSGERQLVCIARAYLASTKILLMDEATSSVDLATDETIHSLLNDKFSYCTIITIAHRLDTVMKSDRILVMDQGQVKEFGPPEELLKETNSHFSQLIGEIPK